MIQKRAVCRLGAILLTATLLASMCLPLGTSAEGAAEKTLLILGDSVATGYSLPDYNSSGNPKSQYSWATLLAEAYGAKQVNLAVDGDTTSDLLDVVQQAKNADVIASADVICISISGNNVLGVMSALFEGGTLSADAVEAVFAPVLQGIEADLELIFTELKAKNPDAKVLMQTLYAPYRYFTVPLVDGVTVADWLNGYIDLINARLKAKIEAYGFLCVDVAEAFKTKGQESWLYDSMTEGTFDQVLAAIAQADPHPTKDGHRGIYDAYVETAGDLLAAALGAETSESDKTTGSEETESTDGTSSSVTDKEDTKPTAGGLPWLLIPVAAVIAAGIGMILKNKHSKGV